MQSKRAMAEKGMLGTRISAAAGADACSIGRAYLYGLSVGGQAGVEKCLSIFQAELEHSMTLLGTQTIKDIKPEHLSKLNEPNV